MVLRGVDEVVSSLGVPLLAPLLGEAISLYVPFVVARMLGLLLFSYGDRVGYGMASEFFEPEPAPVAPPEPLEAQLVRAVETNALDQALALFRRLPERLPPLPAACHLAVGQKAAAVGDYPVAVRALKQVAQHSPEEPLAPKSCVLLARLYGERLGDAASAQKLYRHVVGRYPGTEAARFAQSRLPPVGGARGD
jgi:tetratricopeptide (TPR) repeat protein